ncbi:MAG: DUF6279 family lipoprotein [Gammaproteobacteria bacterium]
MNIKNYKKITLLITFIFISSCSFVGEWWFERIDKYIADYFNEYAEFNSYQQNKIQEITSSYHSWLSKEELPKYRALLVELRDLNKKTTSADIRNLSLKAESLFVSSNNYFHPHVIEFTRDITTKQADQIYAHFEEVRRKRLDERKNRDPKENSTLDSFTKIFKVLKVELNENQKVKIIEFSKRSGEINQDPNLVKFNQENWNKELHQILLDRDKEGFRDKLDLHLKVFNVTRDESELNKEINQLLADLISSFDENQRKKYRNRINFFIKSLDKIIFNYV